MRGFAFQTGSVFELDGALHRIQRLAPEDEVILERMMDGKIVLTTRVDLLTAYREGRLAVNSATAEALIIKQFSRPLQELPARVREELKRRMAYIQAIEDAGNCVYTRRSLEPIIREVADRISDLCPPSVITVYRWHTRYRHHKDVRSLVPRYDRRGSAKLVQHQRILELFGDAVQDAFRASPKVTGSGIYSRLAGKIDAENHNRLPDDQLVVPTLRTVYRMLGRVEAYDLSFLKDGKAVADRRFRISRAGPTVDHILERVEADHTPLDLFLVDDVTRLPLGRPVLTMYIDVYSRFPLGYYLGFGGTSATAVIGALRHAILPKVAAAGIVPNLHVEHRWPCYGRMDALVLDNGLEFLGYDLETVAFDLGIRLQYCPKRQPRFKGVIERFLKTVNYYFTHQIPGTSLARLSERGDYDPQKHAILTMTEFKHVFEKWLLDIYAQTVHRGVNTTPWAKWQEGLKRRAPELPASLEDLQRRIGLVEERSLRCDGITLHGQRYAGPELEPIIRRWGPGVKVRVLFDAEDLGTIHVWPPEQPDPVLVSALDLSYAKGLTLRQHELIRQQVRENGKSTEDSKALAEAKYQLALATDELIHSRKQRSRRRGAHNHGITSANPSARLNSGPAPAPTAKPVPGIKASDDVPPAPLPGFRLNK